MSETPEEKQPDLTGPHNAEQEADQEKQEVEEAEIGPPPKFHTPTLYN